MTKHFLLTTFFITAMLAGCGESAPNPKDAPPKIIEKGIFISARDCAASGKLTLEDCGSAIDRAVAEHLKTATVYAKLNRCTAAEGRDRCDKTVDGYRARLQAFLVTIDKPATAAGLYPAPSGVGFRTATKQPVSALDDTLIVSTEALTLANENAKLGKGRE